MLIRHVCQTPSLHLLAWLLKAKIERVWQLERRWCWQAVGRGGDAAVICQFVWHYDKCICCHYIGYFIASGGCEAACKIVQEVVKVWWKFVSLAARIKADPALFLDVFLSLSPFLSLGFSVLKAFLFYLTHALLFFASYQKIVIYLSCFHTSLNYTLLLSFVFFFSFYLHILFILVCISSVFPIIPASYSIPLSF